MSSTDNKRIHIFGAKSTTLFVAQKLINDGFRVELITVSEETAKRNDIADYMDLSSRTDLFANIYVVNRYDLEDEIHFSYFSQSNFNIGLSIGWQRIIPAAILNLFKIGVFGMHGSSRDLPYGRGRSPMNWAIIERRQFFHTNLFKYLPGIDDGPIVLKTTFSILESDDARTLHIKNMLAMVGLFGKAYQGLISGSATLSSQRDEAPTYYPKRLPSDGRIDWRDSYVNILCLTRAVAAPFRGVFSSIEGAVFDIKNLRLFYTDIESHPFTCARPGQICEILFPGEFLVRCDGGVLLGTCSPEDYLKLKVGMYFDHNATTVSRFPRNDYGFFDIGGV